MGGYADCCVSGLVLAAVPCVGWGGPVRLLMPKMFAYKAVKWLVGMEPAEAPYCGYWEERGYPVDASIKPQLAK